MVFLSPSTSAFWQDERESFGIFLKEQNTQPSGPAIWTDLRPSQIHSQADREGAFSKVLAS
jgi:hypothetical protein